jgi:hypothetical protein
MQISDLQTLYREAESIDQELFAEQRSNLLLYSGEHYNKRVSSFYKRVKDSHELSTDQKLRLTKNHVQFICDAYTNQIVSSNPGVGFKAKNEKEQHDIKAAELHHAVWRDAHERYRMHEKIPDWCDSFVQIGEVIVKIYFDTSKGDIRGYNQKMHEDQPVFMTPEGEPTLETGERFGIQFEPMSDPESPVRQGEFVFEEVFGFNLLRPEECKDMRDARWLGVRKMMNAKDLLARFPQHEDKIKPTEDRTYVVFDSARSGYSARLNQVLFTEYYFRPCAEYPEGYYYMNTEDGILDEGVLPGGVFPLVYQSFRKFPTTPRGRSPIKTMRPYQAEINRSASKMAEHQITLGDDKVVMQHGSKLTSGATLPGVRGYYYSGAKPEVLQGRSGAQYLEYMRENIMELYQVMGVKELMGDIPAQLDPMIMLYRAGSQKQRFSRHIKRFETFLIDIVTTYLKLAKVHLPDEAVIYAIGSNERVNLAEFRSVPDIGYEVEIDAQSEDIETKLGKQIQLNQILQYSGKRLSPEDIGKFIKQMPYVNLDETFNDMTMDYDSATNSILALDRGEKPPINQYDKHPYAIKRLSSRMQQADFRFLDPVVQENYKQKIDMHQQFQAQAQLAIQRAQQGLIPTGGYLATVDLYVPDPTDPAKSKRLRIPSESVGWLVKHLEAQQSGLAPMSDAPMGAQAAVAQKFTAGGQSPGVGGGTGPGPQSPQAAINISAMG